LSRKQTENLIVNLETKIWLGVQEKLGLFRTENEPFNCNEVPFFADFS